MATVEPVRSRAGTPVAADFVSGDGTPIVINMTTGQAYVMKSDGTLQQIGTGTLGPPVEITKDNTESALTLTTPDSTSATWDSQPLAALHVKGPPTATTRNFLSGIWIETNAATTDKGRGLMVTNTGASDSVYLQQDGVGSTGLAALLTAAALNATAVVIGTTDATQLGFVVRQETSIVPTAGGVLMSLVAEGSATEMVRIGSASIAGQIGFVFRLFGANAKPIVVKDAGGNDKFVLANTGEFTSNGTSDSFIEGIVKNGATAQAANNGQAVAAIGANGPGAAPLAVQSWLKHKDSAGNLRYIPLYG